MVEGVGTTVYVCNGLDQKAMSKRRGVTICSCSFLASIKEKKKEHLDYSTTGQSTFHLFSI